MYQITTTSPNCFQDSDENFTDSNQNSIHIDSKPYRRAFPGSAIIARHLRSLIALNNATSLSVKSDSQVRALTAFFALFNLKFRIFPDKSACNLVGAIDKHRDVEE